MFKALPPDVLEHVAYYASTHTLLGPPSGLYPLLTLCRATSATLKRSANPHLYAHIFAAKFDLTAPRRRLARLYGAGTRSVLSVAALADELIRRFTVLKRLRSELDARSGNECSGETNDDDISANVEADTRLDEALWTAFLMVLEDEGRNAAQLRFARIEAWLAVFWFDAQGASGAVRRLHADQWPVIPAYSTDLRHKTRHALGMWLLWFFLNPAAYVANPDLYRRAERILKLVSLNAPSYPLTHLPWTSFNPEATRIHFGLPGAPTTEPIDPRAGTEPHPQQPQIETPKHFTYFGHQLPQLKPLPPAAPANLALLALHARSRRNADTLEGGLELLELLGPSLGEAFIALPEYTTAGDGGLTQNSREDRVGGPLNLSSLEETSRRDESQARTDSYRWECEWLRCVYATDEIGSLVNTSLDIARSADARKYQTYQPGSLDGSWEGPFTYTEFHSFALLLAGAWPSKLRDLLIAQHNQTWRIREFHLLAPSGFPTPRSSSPARTNGTQTAPIPLPVGNPLHAHIPEGVTISEDSSSLHITLPSSFTPLPYSSSSSNTGPLPRVYTYTRHRGLGSTAFDEGTARDREEQDVGEDDGSYASRVLDILIRGEGHSGWGEFHLLGRIRPVDGFISIMKEYTGVDRGRWLYRGYFVGGGSAAFEGNPKRVVPANRDEDAGGSKGYIVGRWRDMLTAAETHGYEGAFAMARRR